MIKKKNKLKPNKNTCKMINELNFSISSSDRSHLKGGSASAGTPLGGAADARRA